MNSWESPKTPANKHGNNILRLSMVLYVAGSAAYSGVYRFL